MGGVDGWDMELGRGEAGEGEVDRWGEGGENLMYF